jgi:hypothetical protein
MFASVRKLEVYLRQKCYDMWWIYCNEYCDNMLLCE